MPLKLSAEITRELAPNSDKFSQIMALNGELFRSVKNRRTIRVLLGTKAYFIKQHRGTSIKEILKNLLSFKTPVLGATPEWQAIQKLSALKIPTTPLVGYGKRHFLPTKQESFLITSELTNQDSVENLVRTWNHTPPKFSYRQQLIKQLAHITRTMHTNGMNHCDLYLCHFLLDHDSPNPQLHLIDLHRTQIRAKTPTKMLIKDLSALYFSSFGLPLTNRDTLRFLRHYFQLPLTQIFASHSQLLNKIEQRSQKLYQRIFTRKHCITHRTWHRVVSYDPNANIEKFLDNPDGAISTGKMLTGEDTCAVARIAEIVIKRFNAKNCWHLLNRLIRRSRARNCWNSALLLQTLKIPTPRPLAIIEERWGPFRLNSYYLTEYMTGQTADNYFNLSPEPTTTAIKLVKILLLLRQKKIKHRDTKANNFIITDNNIYLIDLDTMKQLSAFRYRLGKTFEHNKHRFMRNWKNSPKLAELFTNLFNKYTK